jgi:hypothetical protein
VKCPFVKDGLAFLYMDASSPTFVRSEKSVRDPNQAIAYTLNQMYADKDMKVCLTNQLKLICLN